MKLADEINYKLTRFVANSNEIVLSNFYYGLFEMDVFRLMSSGYVYEYEIKISKSDFLKDFQKGDGKKHELIKKGAHCNKFFFVVPENLITIDDIPEYAGLIYYFPKKRSFQIIKPAILVHKNTVTLNFYRKLAHTLSTREWNLRIKLRTQKLKAL